MIHTAHLTHAYRQAPWRVQRQWAGAFLLGVLAAGMIAALYLDVTAQAAILGREIQTLRAEIAETNRVNADLQSRQAALLSAKVMEARARALGFRPAQPGEIHYLAAPGYAPPAGVTLAAATSPAAAPSTPPEYTQSLLEWIMEALQTPASGMAAGVLP